MGMDTHNLAWAAGFIDGEGCLCLHKQEPYGRYKSPRYSAALDVTQITIEPISKLSKTFGGWLGVRRQKAATKFPDRVELKKVGRPARLIYAYRVQGHTALLKALLLLKPYLVVKKQEALVMIAFLRYMKKAKRTGRARVKPFDVAIRDWYYHKLKDLKKRELCMENQRKEVAV